MGRPRNPANRIYPEGLYPSKGWLFWKHPDTGAWVKICRTEEWAPGHPNSQAARTRWSELSTRKPQDGTVAAMIAGCLAHREQLLREGKLSKRHLEDNEEYAKNLNLVFASMRPQDVNGKHVKGYLEKRSWRPKPRRGPDGTLVQQEARRAPVRANKEISFLSVSFDWAIGSPDWPLVTANPCYGIVRNPTKRRTRCPEVWEIEAAKQHAPGAWPFIFDLAYKGGSRGVQIRKMPKAAIRQEGVFIGKAKNGEDVIIDWDDELIAILMALLEYTAEIERDLGIVSPYVVIARSGSPYTAEGWKTMMYKIVRAAIGDRANPLEQPFSFHDFRRRSATDEEELYGTNPQHRLGHKKRSTTDDYMAGTRTKRVKPLPLRKVS